MMFQTSFGKFLWFLIVLTAFTVAGWLILSAYSAWQLDPVSTSITTHPITELDFPTVTVCPPLTTHTALNYDLMRADNKSLSDKDRTDLKTETFEILTKPSHEEYIRIMVATANKDNLNDIFEGYQSIPEPYIGNSGFRTEAWRGNGSWHTPWYKEDLQSKYYTEDRIHHFVLNFTNIAEEVGEGSLVVKVDVDIRNKKGWEESVTYSEGFKYTRSQKKNANGGNDKVIKKSWSDAQAYCKEEGGSLASIRTGREQKVVETLAGGKKAWIGLEGLAWVDGEPLGFTNFGEESGNTIDSNECGLINKQGRNVWGFEACQQKHDFICQKEISLKKNTLRNEYNSTQLKDMEIFQLWYKYKTNGNLIKLLKMTGMKVTWFIKGNGNENGQKVEDSENITEVKPDPYLVEMVKMANQARYVESSSKDITFKALQEKDKIIHEHAFLHKNNCMGGQIKPEYFKTTFQQIDLGNYENMTNNNSITSEDIETGFSMFSAIVYCSESLALSQFLHSLLSTQSPRTIIQATVNTIESGDIIEADNRKGMKNFYHALDKIFKLQFGKILLATTINYARSDTFLKLMLSGDFPYVEAYKQEIKQCLDGVDCKGVEDLVQTLGKCHLLRGNTK